MDLETAGFIVGLVGAIWMKSSMNLMGRQEDATLLKMIGREPQDAALKAFLRGLGLILLGLAIETYARLFVF